MYDIKKNKRYGILNLSTCLIYVAKINGDVKIMYARASVTDENKFGITVNNFDKRAICRQIMCKMTFNEKGYAFTKGLHKWIKNDNYRSMSFSNTKGTYIIVDRNIEIRSLNIYKIDSEEGKIRTLMNFTSHLISPVSTTYNFITCGTMESRLKYIQLDKSGLLKFQTPIMYKNIKQAKLHDLPGGGYVLLTSKCPKSISYCDESISHFVATKIDANGMIKGHLKVTKFSADIYFLSNNVHIFLKEDVNELCFSSVYKRYLRSKDEQVVEIFCYRNDQSNFTV